MHIRIPLMQPGAVSSRTAGLTGCTHTGHTQDTHTHTRFAPAAGGGRARHGHVTSSTVPLRPFRPAGSRRSGAAAPTYLPAGPPRPRPCRGCAAPRLEAAPKSRGGAVPAVRCGTVLPAPASHSPALRAGWPRRALPAPSRLPSWEEPHLRAAGDAGLVPLRARREAPPCCEGETPRLHFGEGARGQQMAPPAGRAGSAKWRPGGWLRRLAARWP